MVKQYRVLIGLALIWALNFTAMNIVNKQISPFATGSMVRFGTFLLLTAVLLWKGEWSSLFQLNGALPKLLCIGLLGFLLDLTAFIGFRFSDANTGTILLKTDILMANLITMFIYRKKFSIKNWIFTFTMLIGVCFVLGINPLHLQFQPYDIFFILSALFVTLNAFLIQHVQKKYNVQNHVIAYYNNLITFLLFTLSLFLSNSVSFIPFVFHNLGLLGLIGCGALTQALIYLLYYKGLALFPVWIVKIILLLIPIFTLLFSLIIYRQLPTFWHILGSALVLGSALGILLGGKKDLQPSLAEKAKPNTTL